MNTLYIKCNLYRGCHRSCVYLCVQKLPFSTYDVATITTYLAKIIGHHTFVICNAFQISTYFIVYLCIVQIKNYQCYNFFLNYIGLVLYIVRSVCKKLRELVIEYKSVSESVSKRNGDLDRCYTAENYSSDFI